MIVKLSILSIFIQILLAQPLLSQKYFNTNQFHNIPYFTEPQDCYFDSLTNTYFASFSSRGFSDNYQLYLNNYLINYDTAGNILKQVSWLNFIQDTILKTEMIVSYRDSIFLFGNMKVNDSNYLFIANTDTSLAIRNLKYFAFEHNDSNFVYYLRFDSTLKDFNYLFFHRTFNYSNPVGAYTTPYVLKLSKTNMDSLRLYQIHKSGITPDSRTCSYVWSEFLLNDSTFKIVHSTKWDSLNSLGQPQSTSTDFNLRISNIDTDFVYKPQQSIVIWDTSHYKDIYNLFFTINTPALIPFNNQYYILGNQVGITKSIGSSTIYYIAMYLVDYQTDTVKSWIKIPAYIDNPFDSLSAMHILSRRKSLSYVDKNHLYLTGSEGKDGEAIFVYSLDSNLNVRWSRFIIKDSIKRFAVYSTSVNQRNELLIAAYGDIDSSLYDYPVLVKIDSNGSFPLGVQENSFVTGITIYPNPAKDELRIKSSSDLSNAEIVIYNMEGKLLKRSILTYPETVIHINEFDEGFYLFEITKYGNKIMSGKFIKQ